MQFLYKLDITDATRGINIFTFYTEQIFKSITITWCSWAVKVNDSCADSALAVWSEQSKRINHHRGKATTIKSLTCFFKKKRKKFKEI